MPFLPDRTALTRETACYRSTEAAAQDNRSIKASAYAAMGDPMARPQASSIMRERSAIYSSIARILFACLETAFGPRAEASASTSSTMPW